MVGTDLDAHHGLAFHVQDQGGSQAAKRFGQCYRGTAMQQTHGLVCTGIHRHGRAETALVIGVIMNAQVVHKGVGPQGVGAIGVFSGEVHDVAKVSRSIFVSVEGTATKQRILLVEDEEALRLALKLNFELEGYVVTLSTTGPDALERMRGARFDLVVMDVMLPGMDGYSVVETIRLEGDATPVLFLTARTAAADRIRGLRTGDDHLGKPFELEELLLRVAHLIRRTSEGPTTGLGSTFEFGSNHVDFNSYEAVGHDGQRYTLSQREMLLLRLLIERAGEVVSREEILQKVWGYNVFPTTRTVDNFIVAFRKYFEWDPRDPRHFHSVRGVGYKFTP